MTQEDKQLLLVDLCARLPYGVKLLVEGWDSDRDCKFDTVETLIGIDDRFIYTIWDKTGDKDKHSIVEPLSILDYKPYLRPMSSMTKEESVELSNIISKWFDKELFHLTEEPFLEYALSRINYTISPLLFDWLNAHHFDYRGLIEKGLALSTEEFNPYKD